MDLLSHIYIVPFMKIGGSYPQVHDLAFIPWYSHLARNKHICIIVEIISAKTVICKCSKSDVHKGATPILYVQVYILSLKITKNLTCCINPECTQPSNSMETVSILPQKGSNGRL